MARRRAALEVTIGLVVYELCGMLARVTCDLELRRRIDEDIFQRGGG
jgi:hypothetical protein